MTVLVLLSVGMQRASAGGRDLLSNWEAQKKEKKVIYFLLLQPAPNFQFTLIAVGTAVLAAVYFSY